MPSRLLRHCLILGTMVMATAVSPRVGLGDDPPKTDFEVTVPNMHCESCATKIRSQLFTIAGVSKVTTHLADHRVVIVPGPGKSLSAYEIWDKLEKAKFVPSKLNTPDGVYTQRPAREPS